MTLNRNVHTFKTPQESKKHSMKKYKPKSGEKIEIREEIIPPKVELPFEFSPEHYPVLLQEVLAAFYPFREKENPTYFDWHLWTRGTLLRREICDSQAESHRYGPRSSRHSSREKPLPDGGPERSLNA